MKGKRTDLGDATCGIARALHIIGDWWTLLIVRDAFQGHQRFGEFQRNLGVAKNILSSRLKKLVEEDIFRIEANPESPISHRYVLTEKGEQLWPVLVALWQWGENHCFKRGEMKLALVDRLSEQPVSPLQLTARDGRKLGPRDFRVVQKSTPPARGKRPSRRGSSA